MSELRKIITYQCDNQGINLSIGVSQYIGFSALSSNKSGLKMK